ncbi:KAP family NTPase [Hyphococcus sp.]|uniref:KAP family NTPase n=1 Tax=Hyphococcus sp. TaxID=2038636 RepID=UPI0035C777E7
MSIGVSGSWGVGKSSLIKLIRKDLEGHERTYLFVEFNAWLYQGYDDAKASLMEVIARELTQHAKQTSTALDKMQGLITRINWLRVARLSAGSAAALAVGLPPIGLIGEVFGAGKALSDGEITEKDIMGAESVADDAANVGKGIIKPAKPLSPPKEIEAIRSGFEDALDEMDVTLVVLIDDLDRCLPETAISTLEAVRLFLFLKNTAFVIAADNKMIRHAVSKHFEGIDDKLVTNYFDKLIQIPIAMPKLGTQDIRAYLSLLYIDASTLTDENKEKLRLRICEQLAQTWNGGRVDRSFIRSQEEELGITVPPELVIQLDMVERLAPLMSADTAIEANPRLIKRFMNAISIRKAIGSAQGIDLNESVLTKMLLLERCGSPQAFAAIAQSSASEENGHPKILAEMEKKLAQGKDPSLSEEFSSEFFRKWVTSEPPLGNTDLRPTLFVSREHAPLLLSGEQMTTAGVELLDALLAQPDMASEVQGRLNELSAEDLSLMMDKVLDVARKETSWGVPKILSACIALGRADVNLGSRLASFLAARPPQTIEPSIIQRIKDESWVDIPFDAWAVADVSPPVKSAITKARA